MGEHTGTARTISGSCTKKQKLCNCDTFFFQLVIVLNEIRNKFVKAKLSGTAESSINMSRKMCTI